MRTNTSILETLKGRFPPLCFLFLGADGCHWLRWKVRPRARGIRDVLATQHEPIMKASALLLAFFLTLTLTAAEPTKPPVFEVRLVLDKASADSEELACTQERTDGGQVVEERLHVLKQRLLDRSSLKSAVVQKNPLTGAAEIQIAFTASGTKRFAEVTRQNAGKRLAIVIDGRVYSAPRVLGEIAGGKAVIAGSFSEQEALELVNRLSEAARK